MDRLKQIWADVLCLGVDEFGESDSFFERRTPFLLPKDLLILPSAYLNSRR